MKYFLKRKYLPNRTNGKLSSDSYDVTYVTIERPKIFEGQENVHEKCCILEGTYEIKIVPSFRFHRDVPELQDVPDRSNILIHGAAKAEDVVGCIGIMYGIENDITKRTKDSVAEITAKIKQAISDGDTVTIEITSED
jgi:hypothetical protein